MTPSKDPANEADRMAPTPPSSPTPASSSHRRNDLPGPSSMYPSKRPDGLKAVCRVAPRTSRCLDKDLVKVGGFYFQSMVDAKASMESVQWRAPAPDDTIPQTDKEHQNVVKELVQAFNDAFTAKDTPGGIYRRRTTGDAPFYSDWAIEACAWGIVEKAKSIHTEGFRAPIFDKDIVDAIGKTRQWTFRDRIDWLCTVLKTSKSTTGMLMNGEKVWTIIGAPHKLYTSTVVNSVANANRAVWVKNGREADTQWQARTTKRQKLDNAVSSQEPSTGSASEQANEASKPSTQDPTTPDASDKRSKDTNSASARSSPVSDSATAPHPYTHITTLGSFTRPLENQDADAAIIALMHGPLPSRDTIEKRGTKAVKKARKPASKPELSATSAKPLNDGSDSPPV